MRINVGCGMTPTSGWQNIDNSLSLRLAGWPALARVLGGLGLVSNEQKSYIAFCQGAGILYADATRHLPFADNSADVIYSSHMLEHLTPAGGRRFLAEAHRVLAPGGILRIAVPDLERLARTYIETGNADRFVADTLLADTPPETLLGRIKAFVAGPRHHLWMYDGQSLSKKIADSGFVEATVLAAGATTIADPGALDLSERADESVYVEAKKPT